MASNKVDNRDFKFDHWVNVRLEEPHKDELQHLAKSIDVSGLLAWVAEMAFEGYSFSLSWDDYSDSLQVSLVCKAKNDPNYGLGLSSRHPDFDMALLSLRYKHEVICSSRWNEAPPTPRADTWS